MGTLALALLPGGPRDTLGIRVGFDSPGRGERDISVGLAFAVRRGKRADPFICREPSTAE